MSKINKNEQRAIRERAEQIVFEYRIVLQRSAKHGFIGNSIEMPTVFGIGDTPDECEVDTRLNLIDAVATMLADKIRPPGAMDRNVQINVRVTQEEKMQIEMAAKERGYRGVSDYIRTVALQGRTQ